MTMDGNKPRVVYKAFKPDDARKVNAAEGSPAADEELFRLYALAGPTRTILLDGRVAAVCGIVLRRDEPSLLWARIEPNPRVAIAVLTLLRATVARYRIDRVRFIVHEDWDAGIAFARHIVQGIVHHERGYAIFEGPLRRAWRKR